MIERDLAALADRIAPEPMPDLEVRVLARLDGPAPTTDRRRLRVLAAAAAVVAACFLSPQVRAFAADLVGVDGIEFSFDVPEAPPEPRAPLPDVRPTDVAAAEAEAGFPLRVPSLLGTPDEVTVADGGRVVTMAWERAGVLLDQLDGRPGPVFLKEVGATAPVQSEVDGAPAWWIGSDHGLTYVDRDGVELTDTARLSGHSLVWQSGGVTFRLEGEDLTLDEALAVAGSVR